MDGLRSRRFARRERVHLLLETRFAPRSPRADRVQHARIPPACVQLCTPPNVIGSAAKEQNQCHLWKGSTRSDQLKHQTPIRPKRVDLRFSSDRRRARWCAARAVDSISLAWHRVKQKSWSVAHLQPAPLLEVVSSPIRMIETYFVFTSIGSAGAKSV